MGGAGAANDGCGPHSAENGDGTGGCNHGGLTSNHNHNRGESWDSGFPFHFFPSYFSPFWPLILSSSLNPITSLFSFGIF